MDAATPEQHGKLFSEKLLELEHQQELLARRMEKLRYHMKALKTLEELKTQVYQESDIDTACIVSFDLIERDKLRQYIENPLFTGAAYANTSTGTTWAYYTSGNEFFISKIQYSLAKKGKSLCNFFA